MSKIAGRLTTLAVVCFMVLSAACAREKAAEIRVLSEQEFSDLWNKATSREPVGKPVVRKISGETGTTTTTAQAFMISNPGGGRTPTMTICGFACVAPAGTKPADCKTSGCEPSGLTCTPADCGNCTISQPCKMEVRFAASGGIFMARLEPESPPAPTDGLRVAANARR
jgi:hypothetical protein